MQNNQQPKKKQQRPIDFSKYKQRHIAIHLSYVGIMYSGFASSSLSEVNADNFETIENDNTIEYHLFKALFQN
ncbi:hypothetical protein QTN25_009928 [Entamoeba marina]